MLTLTPELVYQVIAAQHTQTVDIEGIGHGETIDQINDFCLSAKTLLGNNHANLVIILKLNNAFDVYELRRALEGTSLGPMLNNPAVVMKILHCAKFISGTEKDVKFFVLCTFSAFGKTIHWGIRNSRQNVLGGSPFYEVVGSEWIP